MEQYGAFANVTRQMIIYKEKIYELKRTKEYSTGRGLRDTGIEYMLTRNGKMAGCAYVMIQGPGKEVEQNYGLDYFLVKADAVFELTDIQIKDKYQNDGLGSVLFNAILKDFHYYRSISDSKLEFIFVRRNSAQANRFYEKWGAEINEEDPRLEDGALCYMIIKEPMIKAQYNGKKICPIKLINRMRDTEKSADPNDYTCNME